MAPPAAVEGVRAAFAAELRDATSSDDLQELRNRYLGRKRGAVTALLKSIASAAPDVRRDLGREANALKREIEEALAARRRGIEATPAREAGRPDAAADRDSTAASTRGRARTRRTFGPST